MAGGGGSKTVTQKIDPDIKNRFLSLYGRAEDVADQPFQLFTGERIAPLNADQMAAIGQLREQSGLLSGGLSQAYQAAQAGLDPSIRDVSTSPITSLNTQAFMNPFTGQVVDTALADLDRARQMSLNQGEDAALAAGAFGGSRHGVADSLTNEAFARQAANTAANLRLQGFTQAQNTAQQLATDNAARALQAQQLNQGADASRAQFQQAAAGNLINLGLSAPNLLAQAGDTQRGVAQQRRDFEFQEFLRRLNKDPQDIALLNSVLAGMPVGSSSTQPGGSAAAGFLGGALGGAQIGAGFGAPGAIAGGVAGGILGML